MIFVDSNVPMYLVGAEHPNKAIARRVLERVVAEDAVLLTSAEVFQEILHRYVAIERREAIGPAFDVLGGVVDEVLPVDRADVDRARDLLGRAPRISARDALHAAVMAGAGVERILSFDRGFDAIEGVVRIAD